MSVFDEIKDKLRIEDVIGETVTLKMSGHSMTGFCPFHDNHNTPALAVWPETQTWKCFAGCGSGDVFDWAEKRDGMDKRGVLKLLARKAGVELTLATPEQLKAQEKRKEATLVAQVAAAFFRKRMTEAAGAPGVEYARSRGWASDTLKGLGYFGKDWDGLKKHMAEAGVDLECSAAVALVGYRGDVAAWGKRWGVRVTDEEIKEGKIHAMPPEMLMYCHVEGRSVVYVSGRRLPSSPTLLPLGEGGMPKSWNPPARLFGERQPYFNACFKHGKPVLIVEGQGDAKTLEEWKLPGIALAGCGTDNALLSVLKKCGQVTVALDHDRAGEYAATGLIPYGTEPQPFTERVKRSLCWKLVEAGLPATKVKVLTWPREEGKDKADANDCLKAGMTGEQVGALVKGAESFLDVMLGFSSDDGKDEAERDEARMMVFELLADVDARWVIARKKQLAKQLDYDSDTFERMLMEARKRAGQDETGRPMYGVSGGRMVHNNFDRMGNPYEQTLLNGVLNITGDLVLDDGEKQMRRFTIEFTRENGAKFQPTEVDVEDYAPLNWLYSAWGVNAIVPAGQSVKEHLRVAMLTLSKNVETLHRYQHTGYHNIDGRMVYLTTVGAVGRDGVQVEIERAADRYRLPSKPENVVEAAKASFRSLGAGNLYITVPLFSTMYLAPLSSILEPAFSVWLYGTTETYKSAITALMMCHYGRFLYNTPPGSWSGSTEVGLRVMAFMLKDMPFWIDDFTAQATERGDDNLHDRAGRVLRDWANRTGGLKGTAEGGLRKVHKPRGIVVNSAEILPSVRSIRSRLLMLEMQKGFVNLDDILERYKNSEVDLYPHAMAAYVLWVGDHYAELEKSLPLRRDQLVAECRNQKGDSREYNHVATEMVAFELATRWMNEIGAIDTIEASAMVKFAFDMMMAAADEQTVDTQVDENPVNKFMNELEQMLADGTAFVRHADTPNEETRSLPESGQRSVNARFIGWYDSLYWYLLDSATELVITRVNRRKGTLGTNPRGLMRQLRDIGLLHPDNDDRFTYRFSGVATKPRVHRIVRSNVGEPSPDSGIAGYAGNDGN